jgi:hypothetical protein
LENFQVLDLETKEFKFLSNEGIVPLSNHCCAQDGKFIYVFGGRNKSKDLQSILYVYDIENDSWKSISLKSVLELAESQMLIAGCHLFIFGGVDKKGAMQNTIYKVNLFTFEVSTIVPKEKYSNASFCLLKIDEDKLISLHGKGEKDSFIFNIEEGTWETFDVEDDFQNLIGHSGVLYFNNIYIFGSQNFWKCKIERKGIHNLLFKEEVSDVKLNIGGHVFPGHKNILCQSPVFMESLKSSSFLDLSKYDPVLMHRVLKYMYGFKLKVSGKELLDLVELSKQIEFLPLEVHCTHQLQDLSPLDILDLLDKQEKIIRKEWNERFFQDDFIKLYCLEKFQSYGGDFFENKEIYERFQLLDEDLKLELNITPKIENEEDSMIPEDKDREIQIREHFSNLAVTKFGFDCVLKSNKTEIKSHKLLFYSSPYFVDQFRNSDTIEFENAEKELELLQKVIYDPKTELDDSNEELFDKFCELYQLDLSAVSSTKSIGWDVHKSTFTVSTDKKTITQNGSDPRLAFSSFVIKKGMKDVAIQMEIGYKSWVGVGVVEADKVQKQDFTWNYSGGFDKHGTNLWSMNGYTWTTDSQTHQKSGKPSYTNGKVIDLKVCVKEQKLKMKTEEDQNWVVELPITLPVCFCVNLGGVGDSITIKPKNKKLPK